MKLLFKDINYKEIKTLHNRRISSPIYNVLVLQSAYDIFSLKFSTTVKCCMSSIYFHYKVQTTCTL